MNAQNESTDVRTQIVTLARELGFDLCRFARADAPEHATQFRDWLDRGEGGEMNYLARNAEKRCDPQQVLPEAKTVIVLALNYFQGEALGAAISAADSRSGGRVACKSSKDYGRTRPPLHPPVASRDMPGVMIIIS